MKTIFVSSTFKDMQYERDIIQEKVLPEINSVAQKYAQRVSFCDLRWGVNTSDLDSDAGSRKVLNVCFDEIDRCKPPMVVILGDRYGWIPDENLIMNAAERKNIRINDYMQSVTALEIEYGALADSDKQANTLFYFREIENEAPDEYMCEDEFHDRKLKELKEKIYRLTNGNIRSYKVRWNGNGFDGMDVFASMLTDDLKKSLIPDWAAEMGLTPFQKEMKTHSRFIEEKAEMFRARRSMAEDIIREICEGKPLTILKGASGSGKSTLFAYIAKQLSEKGINVLPFISSLTLRSNDANDILRNIVYYFEEQLGLAHFTDEKDPISGNYVFRSLDEWRDRLDEVCAQYAFGGNRIVIMVDAVDQLFDDEERRNLIFVPRNLNENVQVVLSCLSDMRMPVHEYREIPPLDTADRRDVILGTLAATGKELTDRVIDEMTAMPAADNPLFLSLLIQRLTMMNRLDFDIINRGNKDDQMGEITKRQLDIIKNCPHELNAMCVELLTEAGRRINPQLARKTAEYIAVSRYGMTAEDLQTIIPDCWNQADFSNFIHFLSESFIQRDDGRFDFSHKSIRAGFRSACENEQRLHFDIIRATYFGGKNRDFVKNEFVYHCIKADLKPLYFQYIEDIMYDDDEAVDIAAKTTYEHCLTDGGEWLCGFLEDDVCLDADYKLIDFINAKVAVQINASTSEISILKKIIHKNQQLTQKLYEADPSDMNEILMHCCCAVLADTYKKTGEADDLKNALEYAKEAIPGFEKNYEKNKSYDALSSLSYAYERTAEIAYLISGRENFANALPLFSRAYELRKPLFDNGFYDINDIGELYRLKQRIAEIYRNFGGENNIKRSEEIHYEILDDFLSHESELTSPYAWQSLADVYTKIAMILLSKTGIQNYDKAMEYALKADELFKRTYNDLPSAMAMYNKANSYALQATIMTEYGDIDNLKNACRLMKKSRNTLAQLYEQTQTVTVFCDMCRYSIRISDILRIINTDKAKSEAIEIMESAINDFTIYSVAADTSSARYVMAAAHERLGMLYTLSDDEEPEKAVDELKICLEMRKQLFEEEKTPELKQAIEYNYTQLATHLYTNTDKYEKALQYLSDASQLADELYNSHKTLLYAIDKLRICYHTLFTYANWDYQKHSKLIIKMAIELKNDGKKLYEQSNQYAVAEMICAAHTALLSVYSLSEYMSDYNQYVSVIKNAYRELKEFYELYATDPIKNMYCRSVSMLAMIYMDSPNPMEQKKGKQLFKEAVKLSEETVQENQSSYHKSYHALMLQQSAEMANGADDEETRQNAYSDALKAAEMMYNTACKTNSPDDFIQAAEAYYVTSDSCARLDDNEDCQNEAYDYCLKALNIYRKYIPLAASLEFDTLNYYSWCIIDTVNFELNSADRNLFSENEMTEMLREALDTQRDFITDETDPDTCFAYAKLCQGAAFACTDIDEQTAVNMFAEALGIYIDLINDNDYEDALGNYAICYCVLAEINETNAEKSNSSALLDKALQQRLEAIDAFEMVLQKSQSKDVLDAFLSCCLAVGTNERCSNKLCEEVLAKALTTAQKLHSLIPDGEYAEIIQDIKEFLEQ